MLVRVPVNGVLISRSTWMVDRLGVLVAMRRVIELAHHVFLKVLTSMVASSTVTTTASIVVRRKEFSLHPGRLATSTRVGRLALGAGGGRNGACAVPLRHNGSCVVPLVVEGGVLAHGLVTMTVAAT